MVNHPNRKLTPSLRRMLEHIAGGGDRGRTLLQIISSGGREGDKLSKLIAAGWVEYCTVQLSRDLVDGVKITEAGRDALAGKIAEVGRQPIPVDGGIYEHDHDTSALSDSNPPWLKANAELRKAIADAAGELQGWLDWAQVNGQAPKSEIERGRKKVAKWRGLAAAD